MKKFMTRVLPAPELDSSFIILPSAFLSASVPQQLQGEFRKLVFVGASPTRGSSLEGRRMNEE